MKRAELETLGLNAEQIDAVMKANGKDIEAERTKYADYDDIKSQLGKANETLDGLKDYDEVKAKVAEYKAAAEKAQNDAAAKVAELELQGRVKDFTSNKKFVNELTRGAINSKLLESIKDDANKGKSIDDLFKDIIGDSTDILVDDNKATPPVQAGMAGDKGKGSDDDGVMAAFRKLNPNIEL